jgi:hypothetical protein
MNLPILVYISKESCPACVRYNEEWEKIKTQLNGKARFVKFNCQPGQPGRNIPPVFNKYFQPQGNGVFPTILLAGPNSYFRAFTPDDKVNINEYSDQYTIKAKKFNSVEIPGGYEYAGRPNTADNTVNWFNQIVNTVPEYDEKIPSRLF